MNEPPGPQPVLAITRIVDMAVIFLVFVAGIQLFVLSEDTDRYFAWTIGVPLSAAFLGAGYWAALVSSIYLLTLTRWVDGRGTLVTAFTSTSLLCLATFLHLDKFHLDSSGFTQFAAQAWVAVYVVVPPTLVYLYFVQSRLPGTNPVPANDVPPWIKGWMALQAGVGLGVGAAMIVMPSEVMAYWPWVLTPLTARTVGAWACALGVAGLVVLKENELRRVAGTVAGLSAFAVLQLIAVARFSGAIDWDAAGWIYVLFLIGLLVVSGTALLMTRDPRSSIETARAVVT